VESAGAEAAHHWKAAVSEKSFIDFLHSLQSDSVRLREYDGRNLDQLTFHAQNEGFQFTRSDIGQVIGALEYQAVSVKDNQQFGAESGLWRDMWGCRRLDYLVNRLLPRFSAEELSVIGSDGDRPAS
jgi:hypothetical protein